MHHRGVKYDWAKGIWVERTVTLPGRQSRTDKAGNKD